MNGKDREEPQLWGELRELTKGVAGVQTEVKAIHRRLDEIGGHLQTREMFDERSQTVGLRFADHEERIKTLEAAGVADHEERIKTLEGQRGATATKVLWIIFTALSSALAGAGVAVAVVGK